ncbi:MAG: hypothetical protein PHW73_01170 [Atribacterota bacterium]|nr:hypothetical protein [Atribacterota bacterium]
MTKQQKYYEFLKSKVCIAPETGLDISIPLIKFKDGRFGLAIELNSESFRDGLQYLRAAELDRVSPTLFDVFEIERAG